MELYVVFSDRVVEEHLERGLSLVGLDQVDQVATELLRQHRGGEVYRECGQFALIDVPQKRYFCDFERIRGGFALGFLLRLQGEFLFDLPLDVKAGVGLEIPHEGLIVLSVEGQFIRAAVVLKGSP